MLQISELRLEPALPKVGDTVKVTLRVRNTTGAPLANVEWKLSGALSKNGTIASLGANSSSVVSHTFTAQDGAIEVTGHVDPSNKIAEPLPLRANNKVTVKTTASSSNTEWDGWARKAANRFDKLIDLSKRKTTVEGSINGATLTVKKLKVGPIDTAGLKAILTSEGLPDDVAQAFADAFAATYSTWASKYKAVVPFAYPAFAAFPLAFAPPMPNVPFPLAIGSSPESATAISPTGIETTLKSKLPAARKSEAGANAAIALYAVAMSGAFQAWLTVQQASSVMGKGPVPSFAPPYVPVGPVITGDNIEEPGPSHVN